MTSSIELEELYALPASAERDELIRMASYAAETRRRRAQVRAELAEKVSAATRVAAEAILAGLDTDPVEVTRARQVDLYRAITEPAPRTRARAGKASRGGAR